MQQDLIVVGKLGKTRGVYGELYITPLTDFPDRFLDLKEIFVGARGSWELMRIVSSRMVGGRPVIGFEACSSPEAAARLTNRELAVPRDALVELPEDTFYIFEVVGCTAFDRDGLRVGKVTEVETYPANDVFIIALDDGSLRLVPATRQAVTAIDVAARKVVIDRDSLLEPE